MKREDLIEGQSYMARLPNYHGGFEMKLVRLVKLRSEKPNEHMSIVSPLFGKGPQFMLHPKALVSKREVQKHGPSTRSV